MLKIYIFIFILLCAPSCSAEYSVESNDIHTSVRNGNIQDVRIFLDEGGDPNLLNKDGHSLLLLAIVNGNIEVFELLLDFGANPNFRVKGANPSERLVVMELAAISSDHRYLEAALKHNGDPNALGSYQKYGILFQAVAHSDLTSVKLLVQNGANINAIGKNGKTPVHTAISVKKYDVAYYLLQQGADLTIENKWGNSPIDIILEYGDAGIKPGSDEYTWYLKFLSALGIDPSSIGKEGRGNTGSE